MTFTVAGVLELLQSLGPVPARGVVRESAWLERGVLVRTDARDLLPAWPLHAVGEPVTVFIHPLDLAELRSAGISDADLVTWAEARLKADEADRRARMAKAFGPPLLTGGGILKVYG